MESEGPTYPTPVPSEAECLRQGNVHFYGLEGHDIDYDQYAAWMQRGHELGYPNCTSELCDCYSMGCGVPRDYQRALELAQLLESKGFPLAFRVLALAYAEGHGVPLNREKAADYARRLYGALRRPQKGVDEDLRYEALLSVAIVLEKNPFLREELDVQQVARECVLESQMPERYAFYASVLLQQMAARPQMDEEEQAAALQEVVAYLEKGVALGDCLSQYLMAVVQENMGDPEGRVQELLLGAARSGLPLVLAEILRNCDTGTETDKLNHAYWEACNLGVSCKERADAQPCHIRLSFSPFACECEVRADVLATTYTPTHTSLVLFNTSEQELSGLSLRLCSADAGVDFCCELRECIAPGETLELNLEEYEQLAGHDLGEDLLVEVRSAGRSACMLLEHTQGLPFFYEKRKEQRYPVQLWWEKSVLGGAVLCVKCTEGCLNSLRVGRKRTNSATVGRCLQVDEVARYGRWQFMSLRGLAVGETLALWSEEQPPMLLRIVE